MTKKTPEKKDSVDEITKGIEKIAVAEPEKPLKEFPDVPEDIQKVARWIQSGKTKKIIVVSGAGVSVAAGIPDFRTPGTGLYDNLQQYKLPYAEAIFELSYYAKKPEAFISLASQIWPGNHSPTLTHSFLALLSKKGYLLRNYSQNIDGLEYLAGLPAESLVECHGHFRTASCIRCNSKADADLVKELIVKESKVPTCKHCKSYVKPDIVFFGEGLPDRFHSLLSKDLEVTDCCMILGTSLQVAPVSMIPDMVSSHCKRILLNRELVGNLRPSKKPHRDVFLEGDCDESVLQLAQVLGWEEELHILNKETKKKIQQS